MEVWAIMILYLLYIHDQKLIGKFFQSNRTDSVLQKLPLSSKILDLNLLFHISVF